MKPSEQDFDKNVLIKKRSKMMNWCRSIWSLYLAQKEIWSVFLSVKSLINLCSVGMALDIIDKVFLLVHGKTTDEWYTNDIWVHMSDIPMIYEWHASTYAWHRSDIRVHTSDIRMTYEYIQVTYEWHTTDMQIAKSRSVKGASHRSVFMSSYLTISHRSI